MERNIKFKIANYQLFSMLIVVTSSLGHLVIVHQVFVYAGRDSWFAGLLGALIGMIMIYLYFKFVLGQHNLSLIQRIENICGKWFGGFISSLYVIFFISVAAFSSKEMISFIRIIYPKTPLLVFLITQFVLILLLVRSGVEVLARMAQLFLPMLILCGLASSLLSIPDKDPTLLQPFLDRPFIEIWQGVLMFATMFCELIVFTMFVYEAKAPRKIPKQSLFMILLILIFVTGPLTGPIMIFDEPIAQSLAYPTYSEIQYIRLSGIVDRLDILGVLMWTVGGFLRTSIFLYAALRGITQILRCSRENTFGLPIVLLTFGATLSITSLSREEVHYFLRTTYPVIAIFFGIALPIGLALFGGIRHFVRHAFKSR